MKKPISCRHAFPTIPLVLKQAGILQTEIVSLHSYFSGKHSYIVSPRGITPLYRVLYSPVGYRPPRSPPFLSYNEVYMFVDVS